MNQTTFDRINVLGTYFQPIKRAGKITPNRQINSFYVEGRIQGTQEYSCIYDYREQPREDTVRLFDIIKKAAPTILTQYPNHKYPILDSRAKDNFSLDGKIELGIYNFKEGFVTVTTLPLDEMQMQLEKIATQINRERQKMSQE